MKRVKIIFLVCAIVVLGCNKEDATPTVNAPTLLSLTMISFSRIDLKWTDNATNETGFLIERSEDNITYTQIAIVNADVTTFSDIDLKPGTKYHYHVSSLLGKINSGYSYSYSTTKSKTIEEKLVGVWKLQNIIANGVSSLDNCEKDDTWEFDLNKGFAILDNFLRCGENDEEIDFIGTWILNTDKTKIRLTTVDQLYLILTIEELTETSLKLRVEGNSTTTTFSFTR